jgi:Domain of unknown function (DUF1942)
MRITTMAAAVAVAAAAAMTSLATASASPTTARLGAAQTLEDSMSDPDTGIYTHYLYSYAVSNLQPSNDVVNAALTGRLWEATVTVKSVQATGLLGPSVPFFNARSAGGDNYRVLWLVAAPHGLAPILLPQGGQATGKIYFDVTGPPPTEVVYNDGLQDRLVWN